MGNEFEWRRESSRLKGIETGYGYKSDKTLLDGETNDWVVHEVPCKKRGKPAWELTELLSSGRPQEKSSGGTIIT